MILSISEQVITFLWTTACGMVIALVYDIFRILRKAFKTGSLVTFVQDILYWLIVSVIMFITIYHSNDGELRAFLFIGAFLGVVLYALTLSRIIMSSSLFIINIMVKIIRFIVFIVAYPFGLIIKLLAIPVRSLAKAASNTIVRIRGRKKEGSVKTSTVKKIYCFLKKRMSRAGNTKDLQR